VPVIQRPKLSRGEGLDRDPFGLHAGSKGLGHSIGPGGRGQRCLRADVASFLLLVSFV